MPTDTDQIAKPVLRPLTEADLSMAAEWIGRPHWQEWWDDPDEAIARIRDKIEGRDTTRPFIFEIDGRPVGYVQYWFVADQRTSEHLTDYPWLALLPDDTVGVDISIGDEADLSKGIGSTVVRMMAQMLWEDGHREIIIDPDAGNARAVRAYEKAGFRPIEALHGKSGDFLIMRFDPSNTGHGAS